MINKGKELIGLAENKEFADELYLVLKGQLENDICYDLAAILSEDSEADLVFSFKKLKNRKLELRIKIF